MNTLLPAPPHPCDSPEAQTSYLRALLRSIFGRGSLVQMIQAEPHLWRVGGRRVCPCCVRELQKRGWCKPTRRGLKADSLRLTDAGREVVR